MHYVIAIFMLLFLALYNYNYVNFMIVAAVAGLFVAEMISAGICNLL